MDSLYDDILTALHGIWQRRTLALRTAWIVAIAGWLILSLVPNRYESQARVLVSNSALLADATDITPANRQQELDSVRQTLTSTALLQNVVRTTDLARLATTDRDVDDLAAAILPRVKVVAQQDNLFAISTSLGLPALSDAANARIARQVTARLVALFVEGNVAGSRQETGEAVNFLDSQLKSRAAQLAHIEAERAAFESKYLGGLPGAGSISDRLEAARGEIARIDVDLTAAQSGLSAVNAQLGATPASTSSPGVAIANSASRTSAVEAQIADGQARGWTNAHPDMIALRSQLARLRATESPGSVRAASSSSANPVYMSLRSLQAERQATVSSLSARRNALQQQVDRFQNLEASNPAAAAEQSRLDRDYNVLRSQYDKLLADRDNANVRGQAQGAGDGHRFRIIDQPSLPTSPASPNRPLLLTLVLIAALAAGAGLAFGVNQARPTFATTEALANASGMTVLGAIHHLRTERMQAEHSRAFRQFALSAAGLFMTYAVWMAVEFIERSAVV